MKLIKPISYISRETIAPMRKWSSENARKVSSSKDASVKSRVKTSGTNLRKVSTDIDL